MGPQEQHNVLLGPVCELQPEQNGSDGQHGAVVDGPFFVASGNATKLLELVDEALDTITLAIDGTIKTATATFIPFTWDGVANPAAP